MNALTPREIQLRIRSGASVAEVAEDTGMEIERIEAFAGPVLAEREHVAQSAQTATVRRRGEAGTHRRLGDLIGQRLRSRGIDADAIEWDAWRQPDLKWRLLGRLALDVESRSAEFIFDTKARICVAHNSDARWMIGEESADALTGEENTVDFTDEMALVRAISVSESGAPGDDVPASELMHDGNEDTSQLDRLYDMLSGISEDSVRIYTGILDEEAPPRGAAQRVRGRGARGRGPAGSRRRARGVARPPRRTRSPPRSRWWTPARSRQKPRPRRRRAKIPTWDEIMFGGPTPS